MIMKRNKIYTEPNGGFRISHNKHLGNKHEEWIVPKNRKTEQLWKALSNGKQEGQKKKECIL